MKLAHASRAIKEKEARLLDRNHIMEYKNSKPAFKIHLSEAKESFYGLVTIYNTCNKEIDDTLTFTMDNF